MAYKDKNDKRIKYSRDKWYRENREKQINKQKVRTSFNKKFIKRWKNLQKCNDCGISFKNQTYLCDLHHINGDNKTNNIGRLVTYSIKMIKKEIRKCVPLCANCHRKRHVDDIYL